MLRVCMYALCTNRFKLSYAQFFLLELKKMGRAHSKTQNRPQVRFEVSTYILLNDTADMYV